MSWDVSLYKFSKQYPSLDDIPDDEVPLPLGSLSDVQSAVSRVFSGTDWSDPIWGIYDGKGGSIEFNVGRDDPVENLALHVRGTDELIGGILALCEALHCQAIDSVDSSFLDQSENPSAGLETWRSYLSAVVGGTGV